MYNPRTTSDIRFSSTGSPCVLTTQPGRGGKLVAAKSNLGGETFTSAKGTGLCKQRNKDINVANKRLILQNNSCSMYNNFYVGYRESLILSSPPCSSVGCAPSETQNNKKLKMYVIICFNQSNLSGCGNSCGKIQT